MSSHLNGTREMLKLLYKVNQKKNTEGLLVYLIQFLSSGSKLRMAKIEED